MKKSKQMVLIGSVLSASVLYASAAVDISTAITTFTGAAEGYVTAAMPAVFTIVGLYFLVRVIKRFTK